jgi:catechol 2,3-dioxygenase
LSVDRQGVNIVPSEPSGQLPAGLRLGVAELSVADLGRSVAFYESAAGLRVSDRDARSATLGGQGGSAVLRLVETPGAQPKPPGAAGLFHVAILLPERHDLAVAFARLGQAGLLSGASDHLVSEALYLDDPDGNGVEIYRDRPEADWPYAEGQLRMATETLDQHGLLSLLAPGDDLQAPAPAATRLGHVHLQVGDLDQARSFWIDALGFALTTTYPGALFMSAGGYHHHVAANVWSSRGRGPGPEGSAGLRSFEAVLPNAADIDAVERRLRNAARCAERRDGGLRVSDPSGATIVFRAG